MSLQPSQLNVDTLKSLLQTEVLRYEKAIDNDFPFKEARKIRKNINRLKNILAQKEQACAH